MKQTKRMLALLLTLIMLVSMVACGSENDEQAAQLVSSAVEQINGVKSMQMIANKAADYKINAKGEPMTAMMKYSFQTDPLLAQMQAPVTTEDGLTTLTVYIQETEDGQHLMYSKVGTEETWLKESVSDESLDALLTEMSIIDDMELFLKYATKFRKNGNDELTSGIKATKVEGTIEKDSVKALLDELGVSESIISQYTGGDLTEEKKSTLFNDVQDLKFTIWIDESTGFPAMFQVDLAAPMQAVYRALFKGTEMVIDVNEMSELYEFYDFNDIEQITIPQEALDAPLKTPTPGGDTTTPTPGDDTTTPTPGDDTATPTPGQSPQ